ncbi:MAG: 50S ribosome-binding GTPase [Phycisphaerae bacterium]|nr:50S ribosome-binding GTPase [Phycisphaerae bacterium]
MSRAATIVACATAAGSGMRALVRLSGDDAIAIVAAISDVTRERGVRPTHLRVAGSTLPCLATVTPGPRSYTGEDTVELSLPANDTLLREIERALLASAVALGAACRHAEPGEFTLRAFTHGRIDLTQAEGIAATIAATTDAQLRAARQLADGGVGRFVAALADRVANDLALVEAGIDFTDEEDVVAIAPDTLAAHVAEVRAAIDERLSKSVPFESVGAVPRVVLVGAPNAGKSTLFNALLGRRRAVESPTAGTTRDALEDSLVLPSSSGPYEIRLLDVAGADESAEGLNPAMQAQARAAIAAADLVVRCVPADRPLDPGIAPGELLVRTKADLAPVHGLAVAATNGRGLDDLRQAIVDRLRDRRSSVSTETLVLSARHIDALTLARAALDDATRTLSSRGLRDPELVASSLRAALDELGRITGAIAPDDVLGRIFGRFCVGK